MVSTIIRQLRRSNADSRRRNFISLLFVTIVALFASVPGANAAIEFQEEYAKLIKAAGTMEPLTGSLFGESLSLYNGGVEFTATDVSLPGNSAIPVAFGRRFVVESRGEGTRRFPLSDWDLEIPYMSSVFAQGQGWVVEVEGRASTRRCSAPASALHVAPPDYFSGTPATQWSADEYWIAPTLYVPGAGSQTVLFAAAGLTKPTDGRNYRWSTKNNWFMSCVDIPPEPGATGRQAQEGFFVRSPDGLSYRFDKMVALQYSSLIHTTGVGYAHIAQRQEIRLYPTRVEDRFGNSVTYNWTGDRLTSIQGSDGRLLTMTYNANGRIATVSDQSRTWTYQYTASVADNLEAVILPDTSRWEFQLATVANTSVVYQPALPGSPPPMQGPYCNKSLLFVAGAVNRRAGVITHPSGAKGTFEFEARRHGRTYVDDDCQQPQEDQPLFHHNTLPIRFDTMALVGKTISGAGIQSGTHANPDPSLPGYYWSYDYLPASGAVPAGTVSHCTADPASCPETKDVAVIAPDGTRTVTQFGVHYGVNEGYSIGTAVYPSGSNTALRTQNFAYASGGTSDNAFPLNLGEPPWRGRGDVFSTAQQHPQRTRVTIQDGATFTWDALKFDVFANPTRVSRGSTVTAPNIEATAYYNHLGNWVLGQIETLHHVFYDETTRLKQQNTYSANAQLLTESTWGRPQKIYTYSANGQLATVSDATGISHATALGDYYRGVPRTVTYADGSGESATVNNIGRLTSVTDEQGYPTSYGYDNAGNLTSVTPPQGIDIAWTPTTRVIEKVAASEYGLIGSHWRLTVTTGNVVTVTYMDAMLRPVLTREWDAAAPGTVRVAVTRFDAGNQQVFSSVPMSSLPGSSFLLANTGTDYRYDAIGRPVGVDVDSELSATPLTTSTQYLSGFQRKVTNPRGYSTTTTFTAWDEPTYTFPRYITGEDSVVTNILRDVWGNPRWVNRSGPYNGGTTAVSRRYVYDDNMKLCKVLEPEGSSSFIDYDVAGNIAWTAPAAYSTSLICDRNAAVPTEKSTRSYDVRNRLLTLTHPTGTAGTTQTYYPDGSIKTLNSGASAWSYEYNSRRLLEKETLAVDGKSFVLDWAYNTSGALASLVYPDSTSVDFAPDAFGRPTRVGSYATNVQYHTSGAIRQFSYGNGIVHQMTQNTRVLPERSWDQLGSSGVVDFNYQYDPNGNVAQVLDLLPSGPDSKTLSYDKFDRLSSANASGLWGNASYTYDPVDNLRRMEVGSRVYAYAIDSATNRVSQVNDGNGALAFAVGYDPRGNVSSKGTQTFTFDKANRMTAATAAPGSSGSESYSYDGFSRRVTIQKTGQSTKRYAVYSQDGQLLHELDAAGIPTNYVYLGGTLLARLQQGAAAPATPVVDVNPKPVSSGNVVVSWNNVLAQGSYILRVTRDTDTPVLYTIAAPTLSRTLTAPNGGTYRFDVTACTTAGVCGTPGSVAGYGVTPKPVASITVPTVPQTGSYTISWTASVGVTGYRVEETNDNGVNYSTVLASTTALSTTRPGNVVGSYRYRVTAFNTWGERPGTVSATVTVQAGNTCANVTALTAPTLSPITSTGVSSYTVQWSASNCATHYKLQESTNGGLTWIAPPGYVDPFSGLTATLSDRSDATYLYRVQASRPQLIPPTPSAWSNQQSITILGSPQPPAVPTGMRLGSVGIPPDPAYPDISVYGNNQTVDAFWDTTAGATYYKLSRIAHDEPCNITDGIEVITSPATSRLGIAVKRVCQGQPFTPAAYSFMVQACNALDLCSAPSTAATVEVHPVGTGNLDSMEALQPVYYHTDALGSPIAETNASGVVTKRMRYEPYGAPLDGIYTDKPGYTGHVADSLTRLNYMQQRYYDPQLGRFFSTDPVPVDSNTGASYNRYAYAGNSPYNNIDPDGRQMESWLNQLQAGETTVAPVAAQMAVQSITNSVGDIASAGMDVSGVIAANTHVAATAHVGYGAGVGMEKGLYNAPDKLSILPVALGAEAKIDAEFSVFSFNFVDNPVDSPIDFSASASAHGVVGGGVEVELDPGGTVTLNLTLGVGVGTMMKAGAVEATVKPIEDDPH